MDENTKRMLLLGRQAPPRQLNLRVEPRSYVSPQNAPIAGVAYRVERHIAQAGWRDMDAFKAAEALYEEKQKMRAIKTSNLRGFRSKVRQNAAQLQKSLRMVKLEWKQQLEAKQELRNKCLEYSAKVEMRNSIHLKKLQQEEEAAEATTDEETEEGSPQSAYFTSPASPLGSPRRSTVMTRAESPTLAEDAHEVRHGADNDRVRVWRQPPPPGKRLAIADLDGTYSPPPQAPGSVEVIDPLEGSSVDEPVAPPGHVREHITAWQEQQAVYRGVLQPGVAANAPRFALPQDDSSSRAEPSTAPAPPSHKGFGPTSVSHDGASFAFPPPGPHATGNSNRAELSAAAQAAMPGTEAAGLEEGVATQQQQPTLLAPQRTANMVARARARSELLRFAAGAGSSAVPPKPQAAMELPDLDALNLSVHGVMGDVTNTFPRSSPSPARSPDALSPDAFGNAPPVQAQGSPPPRPRPHLAPAIPTVHVSRSAVGSGKVAAPPSASTGVGRQDVSRLPPAMHARLRERVAQMGLELPALCGCSNVSVLDSNYPYHCCANCPLHNNHALYYSMLHTLLHTYGVIV